jgi:hypothetical protein
MAGEDATGPAKPVPAEAVAAPAEPMPAHLPAAPEPTPAEAAAASRDAFEAKVLRSFFRDGRLVSIPAQERKKLVVLRHVREVCFPEDRTYPEKEVNQRLALLHPDVAALRRYLVDFRLMTRAAGEYRRA